MQKPPSVSRLHLTASMDAASYLVLRCLLAGMLFAGSLGQLGGEQWPPHHRGSRTPCRIERLDAMEPSRRVDSEAGYAEFFDDDHPQMRCAGVSVSRRTINSKGLLLPSFTNAPQLIYVLQGTGLLGAIIPGCPSTFESATRSESGSESRILDRHQKIQRLRPGDIIALPAGATYFVYNEGDSPLVGVKLMDTSNHANQLDSDPRRFFIAGSPRQLRHEDAANNVFSGICERLLAEAFNVNADLAQSLQGKRDERGEIVRVEHGLRAWVPYMVPEEERSEPRSRNGLEETLCTMRLKENIDNPSRADLFNPRAGRISSANGLTFPILRALKLNAEKVDLHANAAMAPEYTMNAHTLIYVTLGSGRVQVAGESGRIVFDGTLRRGQLLAVPQNFVSIKKAEADHEGLAYVAFKTNDDATVVPLAGRLSAIRALPVGVVATSYRLSQDDASRLKENRHEARIFQPARA